MIISLFANLKFLISEFVFFLNQPAHKEAIKNLTGFMTCLFGIINLYYICLKLRHKIEKPSLNVFLAKASILLSPLITRQGIWFTSKIAAFFSFRIESFLGKSTLFNVNPWSLRHLASIAFVLFALPSLYNRLMLNAKVKSDELSRGIFFVLLFNTLTSRPVLHLGNMLAIFIKKNFL